MKTFYSHLDDGYRGVAHLMKTDYNLREVANPGQADIIIFNGGEDISPSIYGELAIPGSGPAAPSARDRIETQIFEDYRNSGKLLLGICRGAQLLNALNGGKLYQDVDNHGRTHDMLDCETGEIVSVTSTHHQMMIPDLQTGHVVGVASRSRQKATYNKLERVVPGLDLAVGEDVEIVWYPGSRSLCIQGHPEYVPGSRFSAYTWELITRKAG